jgi:pSer/pThr/pTyr-binding forkhead associated (FHA) protein
MAMPHLKLLDLAAKRPYRVDTQDAVVGRDPNNAIPMQGEASAVVSSRHARLIREDGHWWVEDIGSRNGTFVNGRRLASGAKERLKVGDEIGFGATGPKLKVEEAVGRSLAVTMAESGMSGGMATMAEMPTHAPEPVTPPAPVGKQPVRLALKTGDGKRLTGQDVEVVIGRSRDCTIRLEGDMALAVSRKHARIFYSGWKICIEDLKSRNGTWLNRKRVDAPTSIERGDVIEFGAGGPMLTVTDVALLAAEAPRPTATEMKALSVEQPFVSDLPTPTAPRLAIREEK